MKTTFMETIGIIVTASCLILLLLLPGCKDEDVPVVGPGKTQVNDLKTEALAALDDAIKALGENSADWQKTVKDALDKIPAEIQSTLKNEVRDAADRAVAGATSQGFCALDVTRNRIRLDLLYIRAELLKVIGKEAQVEEPEPWLCSVSPPAVDMNNDPNRRDRIEFFGYALNRSPIKAWLVNSGGRVDVSSKLSIQTAYHMILDLGGNGVQLSPDSQKLVLEWKGKEQSTIPVIQVTTPICESKQLDPPHTIGDITFKPLEHSRGDKDFDGHGPHVRVSVKLVKAEDGSRVDAEIFMEARETKKDWTTVTGIETHPIYIPDAGWKVEQIIGEAEDTIEYTDTNHALDDFPRGEGGLVSRYQIVGDRKGDDTDSTQVTITFNRLRLVLKRTANCVSALTMLTLKRQNLLSSKTLQRVEPQLRRIPPALRNLDAAQGQKNDTPKVPAVIQRRSSVNPYNVKVNCCGNS
jgi:hypothetical protein